eukprot:SAG31_NODE_930_length_10920_cov_4.478329_9_plen_101_part_00
MTQFNLTSTIPSWSNISIVFFQIWNLEALGLQLVEQAVGDQAATLRLGRITGDEMLLHAVSKAGVTTGTQLIGVQDEDVRCSGLKVLRMHFSVMQYQGVW